MPWCHHPSQISSRKILRCNLPLSLFDNVDLGLNNTYKPTLNIVFYQSYIFYYLLFLVQGLQLLLDGVLNYLPCPTEASNYALVQSKNEEKVQHSKKQLNEII